MKISPLILVVLGSMSLSAGAAAAKGPATKPNIIVILSDDMGFSDIGCYGSEIQTPNLDGLAAGGLKFTQFYNTGRCCPTRASILTGLHPHQAGIGHMMDDRGVDGYRGDLNKRCVTIAEVLKPAGYRNYIAGKWHVTKAVKPKDEAAKHNWPLQRGFDRFYGTIHGAGSFFDPNTLTRDNQYISPYADPEYPAKDYFYTDAITDHAVRFVKENGKEKPFFLYVAYTAAHWPMHALEKDIAKYKGKYAGGYSAIRDARYGKMIKEGVITKSNTTAWPLPADLGEKEFWEWDDRNMEVFAAMVDNMDQGIGKIVAAIKASGHYENTLICFLQDNGGCAETLGRGPNGKPRAETATLPPMSADELQPDMIPKQTRDGFPVRQGKGVMAGAADTYIAYGEAWAAVSNTPFRKYKHYVHEGGISTPLIMHWPAGIAAKGEVRHQPGQLTDLMATCVEISGAAYPKKFQDTAITPMEGRSLVPTFRNAPLERDALSWEHEGNAAIRVGDMKLVRIGRKGPWELYDIGKDRSEQHNLATAQPETVEKLSAQWQTWAERAQVIPYPEESKGKKKAK